MAVCHVSRLGGVVPPEPYLRADGGKTPEPAADEAPKPIKAKAKKSEEAKEPEKAPPPAESHPAHDEAEDNLGVLWKARWISTDPADPKAAMRDFQSKYMGGNVPQPGHPDPKTRDALARMAADDKWMVRAAVVDAIAKRGDRSLLDAVVARLEDENDTVRMTAAATVVRLSVKR